MMLRLSRLRLALLAFLLVAAISVVAVAAVSQSPASAESTDTGNPWVFQETDDQAEGLVIRAAEGANGQPFIVYDYLNQPIGGFNRAGGFWVAGDNISNFAGSDIYHAQTTISPDAPNGAVCVRNGQLWIGGPNGQIFRCANLGGGFGWWLVA
ncbi:hypothetical protein MXD62_19985 [Frankia sp. Mgl5]|uniref:hypothetical protein n=1 Tax=Frankia sp. Mgl5 TaxID=2933793 RepID=UPI00200E30F1|nr:hypothetical protein [Frankia sp. Mgl5]MCK9929431.1 hypothetical protein [Frankia sp. Mgl5]